MADNITAPASGSIFATDEIAGTHYPRTKLVHGADGTATDVSDAAPLPVSDDAVAAALQVLVTIAGGAQSLPTGAATENTLAALLAKLPASLGAKAASGSLSIVPATGSDWATDTSVKALAAADDVFAITPGTAALSTVPKALLVTAAGTLSVGGTSNTPVSLGQVAAGQIIPLRARYVYATGTTATVVGLA